MPDGDDQVVQQVVADFGVSYVLVEGVQSPKLIEFLAALDASPMLEQLTVLDGIAILKSIDP